MRPEALEIFVEVMRTGGFAAAARQRDCDPSSISRTIASLERELGCRLFERTTRRFQPTEAGRIYFEQVEPLLSELSQAAARARDVTAKPAGLLRVTTSVAFGCEVLTPLIGDLRARFPELEVEFVLTDANIDLYNDRIDVAIRLGPPPDCDLVRSRLMATRHRVCASPAYIHTYSEVATPQDLAVRDCIRFPFSGFSSRWRFRRANGGLLEVPIKGSIVISNALALKRCVLSGLGPGLLADWMIKPELESGRLIELLPEYDVTASGFDTAAWILYPSRTYVPLKVRAFIDFLCEKVV